MRAPRIISWILLGVFLASPQSGFARTVQRHRDFDITQFTLRNPFRSVLPVADQKETASKNPKEPLTPGGERFGRNERIVNQEAYRPGPRRDPRLPAIQEEPKEDPEEILARETANISLTGLIWDSDKPQAIVNGEVMAIGDKIGDMTIVGIDSTGIEVEFKGQRKRIKP